MSDDLKEVNKVYVRMEKVLLGVRESTPTANCLIELGLRDVKSIVHDQRKAFLKKKLAVVDLDEPFHIMMEFL